LLMLKFSRLFDLMFMTHLELGYRNTENGVGVLRMSGTTQIVDRRRKFWHWVAESHQLLEDVGAHVLKRCCIVFEEPAILTTQIRTVETGNIVYSGYYIIPMTRRLPSNVARLSIALH
jgi:hypothetical protein